MIDLISQDHRERVLREQLTYLCQQSPISLGVNLLNGLILSTVQWQIIDHLVITAWLAGVVLVTAGRYGLLRAYRKAADSETFDPNCWAGYFRLGACTSGLIWGAGGWFLFPSHSMSHQIFLSLMIGGMIAGALPLLSPLRGAYVCFILPALAPLTAQMFLQGDSIHMMMGLMGLIFGTAMLSSATRIQAVLAESIDLRLRLSDSIAIGNKLQEIAYRDALTGVGNRRLFDDTFNKEWARAMRNGKPLSLIIVDIDYFKAYNDNYGHQAGDECLRVVAQAIQGILQRPSDLFARLGGEEFAILLPETGEEGTAKIATSTLELITDLRIPHRGSPISEYLTISLGSATAVPRRDMDTSLLFDAADRALYRAKKEGRNCFIAAPTLTQEKKVMLR